MFDGCDARLPAVDALDVVVDEADDVGGGSAVVAEVVAAVVVGVVVVSATPSTSTATNSGFWRSLSAITTTAV